MLKERNNMAFKPQGTGQDAMSDINVTPLVDVMLVLVIIVMAAAQRAGITKLAFVTPEQ
jgi:biopolymer transport protein ExbD